LFAIAAAYYALNWVTRRLLPLPDAKNNNDEGKQKHVCFKLSAAAANSVAESCAIADKQEHNLKEHG